MPNSPDNFYLLNYVLNVIDDLRMTKRFLEILDDGTLWKWVSISITNALYGTMLAALMNGDQANVMATDRVRKKACKDFDELQKAGRVERHFRTIATDKRVYIDDRVRERIRLRKVKIISFKEALARIQDPKRMKWRHQECLKISKPDEAKILKVRQTFRNNFEHFPPGEWGIDVGGFPDLCFPVIDSIEFLFNDSRIFGIYEDFRNNRHEIEAMITDIKSMLRGKRISYGASDTA